MASSCWSCCDFLHRRHAQRKRAPKSFQERVEKLESVACQTQQETFAAILNSALRAWWPHISDMISGVIFDAVEPALQRNLHQAGYAMLSGIYFDRSYNNLGTIPLEIEHPKVFTRSTPASGEALCLQFHLKYFNDDSFYLRLPSTGGFLGFGIRDLKVYGDLVIEFVNPVARLPFLEGFRIYFLEAPDISFDFSGVISVLHILQLHSSILSSFHSVIKDSLVLPNMVAPTLPYVQNVWPVKSGGFDGSIEFIVHRAVDLVGVHSHVFTDRTSDSFVKVHLGADEYVSPTVLSTLNPEFEYRIFLQPRRILSQKIMLELVDASSAASLGRLELPCKEVLEWGPGCHSFELEDHAGNTGKNGKVFLSAKFFPLHARDTLPWWTSASEYAAILVGIDTGHVPADQSAKFWVRTSLTGQKRAWPSSLETSKLDVKKSKKAARYTAQDSNAKRQRKKVKLLRQKYKATDDDIAELLGIDPKTLQDLFCQQSAKHKDKIVAISKLEWVEPQNFIAKGFEDITITFDLMRSLEDNPEVEEVLFSSSRRLDPACPLTETVHLEQDGELTDITLSFHVHFRFYGKEAREVPQKKYHTILGDGHFCSVGGRSTLPSASLASSLDFSSVEWCS